MKKLIALSIIFVCVFQTKAQTISNNTNTYQYAILHMAQKTFGGFSLDLFLDNRRIDLYKTLNLDTLDLTNKTTDYAYILTSLNYMDKSGYELVTSSATLVQNIRMTREYIFRKKITDSQASLLQHASLPLH